MGRGAIPSRRGFSRGAMRHPGVSGITRPFGRLSRGRGQVLHVLLSRSPLASLRRGVPFDLHVLGAPPAFILSQDRTLRPKYMGFEPVRSSQLLADRFRSIHMVLLDRKRNFSGPPLGGLAKNKSKLDHFKWFDVCPDATHHVCPSSQYPVLKVHACAGSRFHRAARQGDILPDRRGPAGGNLGVHISSTIWDSQLYLPVIKKGPRFRDPLLRLSIETGFQSLRPTTCDRTPRSRQVLHLPRRHPRP